MLQKLSLWKRIAIPLVAMALGIIIVSGTLVSHYYARLVQAQGMTSSAEKILSISHIIHEMQKERGASALFLNGAITLDELKSKRESTDQKMLDMSARKSQLPSPLLQSLMAQASEKHQMIRNVVDQKKVSAGEVAKLFGDTLEIWIKIQVGCAHAYHLDGLEATLLSISIFEKSKESMGRMRALLNAILAANQPIAPETVSLLATHKAGIITNLESPGLSISSISQQEIEKILVSEDWKRVEGIYKQVMEKTSVGNYGFDAKEYSSTITRVIDHVRDVMIPEIERTSATIAEAASDAQRAFLVCTASVLSLIILSMLVAGYVTRRVNESLNSVSELLSHGADAVARIAVQVASASQNLAASATQQASAMQETTAAVEETQSMIKKNADHSKRSAEISHKSFETAVNGKVFIDEMTQSIGEIALSNDEIMKQSEITNKDLMEIMRVIREIEGKTRVINDIVFQTRLLSFNASVEAARAGEQGKGFAVVAEEVGNLAQMSGSSARDIQSMLESSVNLVESIVKNAREKLLDVSQTGKAKIEIGVQKASRCGGILQEIVDDVALVEKITNEISIACQEQSDGIEEINKAMTEMDAAAHQNSAACEQTSSSAEELKKHAGRLLGMVGKLEHVIHGAKAQKTRIVVNQTRPQEVVNEGWDQAA
jgi:methyl-accepting chemotaxis protein